MMPNLSSPVDTKIVIAVNSGTDSAETIGITTVHGFQLLIMVPSYW